MNGYDFSTLNDKEFEHISIDLISIDKEKRFERFKAGKDGGIDGRFYHSDGSQEIIQCKHYLKTGFDGLIASLKKKNDKGVNEIDKVNKLNPIKYIFVTSLQLSANNKKTIKELFIPYIQSDNDIYGQEDLNVILSDNTNIEEKYYKLWISSTVVLNRIMNNAIKSRSEALVENIKEKSKYYVITENHNKAIEILEKTNVIIIAGEPGIGKTTLAKNMAIFYIEKDFECYDIENAINEAESIFEKGKKQIFYFDDFLGSNYLEALENKKDSHIMKFIERVKRDKFKRFILTSRTNIFNQSILLSDTFKSKNIDEDEFIISIASLKEMDKAYILYNHIWHSNLEETYIDEIYKDKRYKNIINHKNFSPRIIEFITDTVKIKKEDVKPSEYWVYLVDKLNNPQDIWKNTFDKQSDDFIRTIVVLVVLNGNKIEENELKNAYISYIKLTDLKNSSYASKEFESIVEEVVKYFLNRTYNKIWEKVEYTLFNPSIADFVLNRYSGDTTKLMNFYLSLQTLESLKELHSRKVFGKIDVNIYENLLTRLHENLDISNLSNIDYIIQLLYMTEIYRFTKPIENEKRNKFFQNFIDCPQDFKLIDEFITTIIYINSEDLLISNYDFIFSMMENMNLDESNINKIIELLKYFDIHDDNIDNKLNKLIHEYLESELDSCLSQLEIDDVEFENDKDGVFVRDEEIKEYVTFNIDTLIHGIDKYEAINIDRDSIADTVNIEDINYNLVNAYMEAFMEEGYDHKDIVSSHNIDSIEDLFER